MREPYTLVLRAEWPGLIGLDWARPIGQWRDAKLVDLPRGISRHTVVFVDVGGMLFALKELPQRPARRDYDGLRRLEELGGSAVRPVGLVTRAGDPDAETAAVLITRYADYSFSYRELLAGPGPQGGEDAATFGRRRGQLLDALAFLLVELHMLGCYWGDCSLSNALYRYDAGAIEPIMVDAETAELHDRLSDGQRRQDVSIMVENVAAEMMDIAASKGLDVDAADWGLGEDIARRYEGLWGELAAEQRLPADSAQYRINGRIRRLNDIGFEVEEINVVPEVDAAGDGDGRQRHLQLQLVVADRNFHVHRLRELTGVDASENQARQILSDLRYYQMQHGGTSPTGKALSAARWRVHEFEPWLRRLSGNLPPGRDPVQAYCDVLHHRYMLSLAAGHDVGTEAAFQRWLSEGRPGYPLPD